MSSAKPVLALLHGWGMNARVFDALAGLLADDFEVRALNLPGHGGRAALAGQHPAKLGGRSRAAAAGQLHRCSAGRSAVRWRCVRRSIIRTRFPA